MSWILSFWEEIIFYLAFWICLTTDIGTFLKILFYGSVWEWVLKGNLILPPTHQRDPQPPTPPSTLAIVGWQIVGWQTTWSDPIALLAFWSEKATRWPRAFSRSHSGVPHFHWRTILVKSGEHPSEGGMGDTLGDSLQNSGRGQWTRGHLPLTSFLLWDRGYCHGNHTFVRVHFISQLLKSLRCYWR
jgi:hypothetical protein